jgi:hypothetical protein
MPRWPRAHGKKRVDQTLSIKQKEGRKAMKSKGVGRMPRTREHTNDIPAAAHVHVYAHIRPYGIRPPSERH